MLKIISNVLSVQERAYFMKKRHVIITTILFTLLFLFNTGTIFASTYEGRLDGVQGNTISGWAWDNADPESFAVVRVVVKKQGNSDIVEDLTAVASMRREDLISSGRAKGNHGFSVTVNWDQMDPGFYTVEAYIGDSVTLNPLTYQNGQVTATSGGGSLVPLGIFKSTAYCPCYSCSEGWGRNTSTGAMASASHTIAVDPRVVPYGSKLMINGIIYTAEDRGGGVRGKHIDIFFNSHGETRQYGARNVEVFLVQ